jgi:hypothetical protein
VESVKDTLDFIVIGAQKAGTTSLFRYLKEHPEISMPQEKEVPFFCWDAAYERGFDSYMANLRNEMVADPARKWGTSTPHYMSGSVYQSVDEAARNGYDERTVPARIQTTLPDVRLIAILRDPVERALAGHREAIMKGHDRRSFDEAIRQLLAPEALADARARSQHLETGYVVWGEYGRILAGYFDVFPREQLLVVFTADLERAPTEVLGRIQRFIGVQDVELPNVGEKYNSGVAVREFSWTRPSSWTSPYSPFSPQAVQARLRHNSLTRAAWHAVPNDAKQRAKHSYARQARRAVRSNRRQGGDPVDPATLELLREHYAADTETLTKLLGVTPPWAAAAQAAEPTR